MSKQRLLFISLFLSLIIIACSGKKTTEYLPVEPNYQDSMMWFVQENDSLGTGADVFYVVSTWETDWTTENGQLCHYADVWNTEHRRHMSQEISAVAKIMGNGNNFYSPFYRHTTIEAFATLDEDTIVQRCKISMQDVKDAFDTFWAKRDTNRPFVIAGFSQGAIAVVELLKHMTDPQAEKLVAAYVLGYKVIPDDTAACHRIRPAKDSTDVGVTICYNTVKDVKYIKPVVASPCVMCINPVNWTTDSTPAIIHDTITITCSPYYHVLVCTGYAATEYPPIGNFLNIGDIHSCEPWLYSECLTRNIALRTQSWRNNHLR